MRARGTSPAPFDIITARERAREQRARAARAVGASGSLHTPDCNVMAELLLCDTIFVF